MKALVDKFSKWDTRRLALARFVAGWSKDPKAQVGAVITDNLGRVIALGYNGFAVGIEDSEGRLNGKEKLDMILHAEENAVLIAGERGRGGTIYVFGKPTCAHCASVIIQSGLKRIVSPNPDDESWIGLSSGYLQSTSLSRLVSTLNSTMRVTKASGPTFFIDSGR